MLWHVYIARNSSLAVVMIPMMKAELLFCFLRDLSKMKRYLKKKVLLKLKKNKFFLIAHQVACPNGVAVFTLPCIWKFIHTFVNVCSFNCETVVGI